MSALPSVGTADAALTAETTRVLYERYSRRIFAYCVSRLGSRDEAEDAMQTTFLNAFRSLQSGVVPQFELAWLFRIAENVCRDGHKSASRRRRVETTKDLQEVQDFVSAPQRSDGLVGIADALASMPERQRQAILLREWQGLSYGEIATKLELSGSAVETLIFRARRTLARALEDGQRRVSSFNLLSLLGAAKSVFQSSAAAKVATSALAVGGATFVATVPLADQSRSVLKPESRPPTAAVATVGTHTPTRPGLTSAETAAHIAKRVEQRAPRATARGAIAPGRTRHVGAGPAARLPGRSAPASEPSAPVQPPAAAPDGTRTVSPPPTPVASPPAVVPPPPLEVPGLPGRPELPPVVPPVEPPPLPPLPEPPVGLPTPPPLLP